jgi:hypothetical protein
MIELVCANRTVLPLLSAPALDRRRMRTHAVPRLHRIIRVSDDPGSAMGRRETGAP